MGENMRQQCPRCRATKRVRIVYGFPGRDLIRDFELGKVALGGCLVDPSNPRWKCALCGETWGRMGPTSNGH
jgi:transposase-like protein